MNEMTIHPNEHIMKRCIDMAQFNLEKGQYALGALVVDRCGQIISESASRLITGYDPTAHPEIIAIREAAQIAKSRYLPGYYLYTTLEPCPMCTSAVIWAKMEGIVFGALQEDAIEYAKEHPSNIYTWRQITINSKSVAENGTPKIKIYGGILREECKALFALCH